MIRRIFTIILMGLDVRNMKFFWMVHKEFSKDKRYSIINFIKALWLVSNNEKIIRFEKYFIISSFLPPMPSKAFFQVFNAVPAGKSKFDSHINAERTAPISMFIAITERCNYNCWHCSKANRGITDDLPISIIKKTINDLQDMGVAIIGLTGGEPLLRNDLEEIIDSIDDRSISIIYTTGNSLTYERAKRLKEVGLFGLGISLDHYDKETYDKKRGYKGAFEIALKAISISKKAKIYTMIQLVATKESISNGDIWKMIEFAKKLGVHEIRILEVMPTGKLIKISSQDILNLKERQELINIQERSNSLIGYPKVTTFAKTESFEQFGCGAGTQHSYIDSHGNLCPCDFVPLAFGNIKERPIKELWKEMNQIIGVPRKSCMIMELQNRIGESSHKGLPISYKESKEICRGCEKMKKLPGFYSMLKDGK